MRTGRHGRNKEDAWDSQPSRSAQTAAAVTADAGEPRLVPGKKDRRAWCKVNKGPHTLVLGMFEGRWTCGWNGYWRRGAPSTVSWRCYHQEVCSGCGKITRRFDLGADCPDYEPDGKARYLAKLIAQHEEWVARHPRLFPGRPDVGPTHYRKPKKEAPDA
jgi:hypothetical protein